MVSLSDYKDAKGFVIIFTCNTCPFAVAIPYSKEFAEERNGAPLPCKFFISPGECWAPCEALSFPQMLNATDPYSEASDLSQRARIPRYPLGSCNYYLNAYSLLHPPSTETLNCRWEDATYLLDPLGSFWPDPSYSIQ